MLPFSLGNNMQVLAYPVYRLDVSDLPTIETSNGPIMPVKYGDHITNEIIEWFAVAVVKGCQWIVFKQSPIVRDELEWVDIPQAVTYGKSSFPVFATMDAPFGFASTVYGTAKSDQSLVD